MLQFEKRESETECNPNQINMIQEATGLLASVAQLLCRRGIDTPLDAKRFLHPGPEHLHDPFLLPDMAASVSRIQKAVEADEKITVFCDYDADGTCGGCALYLHLRDMGADANIMTPNRHKEGYGLNTAAIEQIAGSGVTLVITVDCGITNIEEVALAATFGIDVIVTDHHECAGELPDTPYIINPKRPNSGYPCPYLAGCGVAFKLIHALSSMGHAMQYIDLVAIGTITDIVPLLDENRAIAHLGIQKIRNDPSVGILALANAAGIALSSISSFGISFGLGPRINAAGRMDTASLAISVLKATQRGAALRQNAMRLCKLNDERKKEVDGIFSSAEEMIFANGYMKDSAILLADERWNTGVIGIAAAKIAEKYLRPCVLFSFSEGSLVGSARSISGINIFEVLSVFSDRYEKFGGHAQAAGLTIKPVVLDGLRRDVCAHINQTYDEDVFVDIKQYDMELDVKEITGKLVKDIERLAPFGQCNEKPGVAVLDADMTDTKFVGKDHKPHLKFVMRKNDACIEAISFFFKDAYGFMSNRCDFLCEAGINEYNGKPQLIVRHMAAKYDPQLIESFYGANKSGMIQCFIEEVVWYCENGAGACPGTDETVFLNVIRKALAKSHFGLCIIAGAYPALAYLSRMGSISAALADGTLMLYDRKSFSADNCIAFEAVSGHERVYRIGLCPAPAFYDERLIDRYRQHAAEYFAETDELRDIYRKLCMVTAKKARMSSELSRIIAVSPEKMAFVLQVFNELKLIDIGKSGRILALKNGGQKRELRESVCYRSFEDLISGKQEQGWKR